MELIARTVIPRHCVERGEDGLSHMQRELLASDALISIVQAPTGAGKSYVLRRAVQRGERILFFVPTRRLGQNQAEAIIQDLTDVEAARTQGVEPWSEAMARRKVQCWDSTFSESLRERWATADGQSEEGLPKRRASDYYARHVSQLHQSRGGEIVFATPELINYLLLNPCRTGSRGDVGPGQIVTCFDRIVFDEFHLTEARGFGFIAMLAGIAKQWAAVDGQKRRARIVLLSATPVDVAPVLEKLGFDRSQDIRMISERVTPDGGRALHGDVVLDFVQADGVMGVLDAVQSDLVAINSTNKALIIYDSLRQLRADEDGLLSVLLGCGIGRNRILLDSSQHAQENTDISGREKDLDERDVIVATSTIEVGVTIRGARLMITESGLSPLNLLQRIGRVSRGNVDGRVIVVATERARQRNPWLSEIIRAVQTAGDRMAVSDLMQAAANAARVRNRFSLPDDPGAGDVFDADPVDPVPEGVFGCMSMRGAFAAGIYWNNLLDGLHEARLGEYRKRLAPMAPKTAGLTHAWMRSVEKGVVGGRQWVKAFREESKALRSFTPTITIVQDAAPESDIEVQQRWLALNSTVLEQFPVVMSSTGQSMIRVPGLLKDHLRSHGDFGNYGRLAVLPGGALCTLRGKNDVAEFCAALDRVKAVGSPSARRGISAAQNLVRTTGVVPYDDEQPGGPPEALSGIL